MADDNAVMLEGMRCALTSVALDIVGSATTGRDAVRVIRQHEPDVAFLDVRMPGMSGIEVLDEVATETPCVVVTYDDSPETVRAAARSGASGYMVHGDFGPCELRRAAESVASGSSYFSPLAAGAAMSAMRSRSTAGFSDQELADLYWMTPREITVLREMVTGASNAEVAAALGLTTKTVKNNVNRVFFKLRVRSRAEALALWHNA